MISVFIELILKNEIVKEIFGPNYHSQIITKSKEIIELLLNDTETIKVCVPQGTTTASIIPDETDDTNSTIQICLGNQTDESCPNDNKLMIEKNGNNYFYSNSLFNKIIFCTFIIALIKFSYTIVYKAFSFIVQVVF